MTDKKLKPFDLEAAKNGAPVCTRDGRPARIICFDRVDSDYPIVALVQKGSPVEGVEGFTAEGRYYVDADVHTTHDLFMAQTKREGWVNVYRIDEEVEIISSRSIYKTRDEALAHVVTGCYIDTVKIEWEE